MNDLPKSLQRIESVVASAKNYVVPSDNLRPRILEAARARQSQRLSTRRMFQVAALVFLCVLLTIPAQQHLDAWRRTAFSPTAGELEMRAQQYADQPAIGQNWGMYEAYKNLRQQQQTKITGGLINR